MSRSSVSLQLVLAFALGVFATLALAPAVAQVRPALVKGAGSAGVEKEPTFRFNTVEGRPSASDCDRNVIKVPPKYGDCFAVTTEGKQSILWFRAQDGTVRNVLVSDEQTLFTVVISN